MNRLALSAVALLAMAASAAHATTIVNLSASSATPNAGPNSGGYAFNPVSVSLAAGTYSVGVVGIAGGGLYDAYSVYAPTATNGAFSDGNWSVSVNGAVQTVASDKRFNTATDALAYYSGKSLSFTLASASNVTLFYLDDTAFPYFGDDAGGVSLAVNAIPEPASVALFGVGFAGLGFAVRRRAATIA